LLQKERHVLQPIGRKWMIELGGFRSFGHESAGTLEIFMVRVQRTFWGLRPVGRNSCGLRPRELMQRLGALSLATKPTVPLTRTRNGVTGLCPVATGGGIR
jgi:hypothetical protein